MASSLQRIGKHGRTLIGPLYRSFASSADALVDYKPGEIGLVSGIPDEHLTRRPARTASQQGSGRVGRWKINFVSTQKPKMETKMEETTPEKSGFMGADSSFMQYTENNEWDEFGNDLYAIPEVVPVQSSSLPVDVPPTNKADEDSKIKALIDTPALDWQRQGADGFGPVRGFGWGMNGRMGGRGFGMERKTPPQGYVCHRCKTPGESIYRQLQVQGISQN